MTTAILTTKFYIPPTRPELISRQRLIEKIQAGLHRKLTLISAPAGFGKTTLVTEWAARFATDKAQIAWLSLDQSDNDPARFLTYFISGLKQIEGMPDDFGETSLAMLNSPQLPPMDDMLVPLINEIAKHPTKIVFVLDDFHLIEQQPVHDALIFLFENQPQNLHLVMTTRVDPPLPLPRLRSRCQLTELRAADLRFTLTETAEFLNRAMGLQLSEGEISALESRTEGWIVGLQMAALSMQGSEDHASFVQSFTGSHHLVLDYLIEEVLQRQPEQIRSFLLQTSLLDRLSGDLCQFVTGYENSGEILHSLSRGSLFVVPLDDQRQWYRYHHLFADVLQSRLIEQQPDQVAVLHRRASEWFEENHQSEMAVQHALAAPDYEKAAELIELIWPSITGNMLETKWLSWVKALPAEILKVRPNLSYQHASTLMLFGDLEGAEHHLQEAEHWLTREHGKEPPFGVVFADEAQWLAMPLSIAIARSFLAQARGDFPGTVKYAQHVLDQLPEDGDPVIWGRATTLLGLASWSNGDLFAAKRAFADFVAKMQAAGNIMQAYDAVFVLAEIIAAQGHLREAMATCEKYLKLGADQGGSMPLGSEDLYRGLGEISIEQDDLEAAEENLARSKQLGEQDSQSDWQRRWCVSQARFKAAQGDLDAALALLDEAELLAIRNPLPNVRPIPAQRARIYLAQGRLASAQNWVLERELTVDDDLNYLYEFEHLTVARVLIVQFRQDRESETLDDLMQMLERLHDAAKKGRRTASLIEILVLQALTFEAQDDFEAAIIPLEQALTLAEPEGYARIFISEGPPMVRLLDQALSQEISPNYVRRLKAKFPLEEVEHALGLIDPLSQRELEVLQLIAGGLTNQEIADQLYLALNTVKVHTRNIYGKLDTHHRAEAIAKARRLGLLPN